MADSGATADLHELSDKLYNAYWSATTIDAKDTIRNAEKLVDDAIISADAQAITDRTEAFKQLSNDMPQLSAVLKNLQNEINSIIKNTQMAADVLGTIAKILPYLNAAAAI